jgi:Putative Actinobacterial Holin-X, holin superfamily III
MATPPMQRSVPELLQNIVNNLQEIIRSEFRLAKTEFRDEVGKAAKPAAAFGTGLVLSLYGIGFLLLAAVYGLSTIMAGWVAALLVGAVLTGIAISTLLSSGKKLKQINLSPDKTIRNLEENVQWAKQQVK